MSFSCLLARVCSCCLQDQAGTPVCIPVLQVVTAGMVQPGHPAQTEGMVQWVRLLPVGPV
jgi:hypothetical protein